MRRAVKISLSVIGVLALLLVSTAFVAMYTDSGRSMIERLTLRLTSGHVALSGLNSSFPQQLMLDHLQLSDERGIWLTADKISVQWSLLALLEGRLQIDALHVVHIDIERLPVSPATKSGPVSIPRIDVAAMSVDLAQLGAELAGSPASLVLAGNAHLRSVQDMIIHAQAHRIDGDGDYQLQLQFDTKRMDAVLNMHEPADGPLENLLKLPGLGALAVTVNLNGPRAAEHLDLSVDAGAFRGRAQGSFNLIDSSADLEFAFDSPAMAPRADLSWQHASVHGHWHGSVRTPTADGHVEIDQLQLPGDIQLANFNGDLTAKAGAAAMHALISGLRVPGPQQRLLENSPLKVDVSMQLDKPTWPVDLSASHRLFSVHAVTEAAAAVGKRAATFEIRLPNLTELAALVGQKVQGSAFVKARLVEGDATTHVTVDANAALGGTEIWSGLVGNSVNLQLTGSLTERAITLENMKVTGRAVSLIAKGEVLKPATPLGAQGPSTLHAQWDLNATDLHYVSPALAGNLKVSGSLDGPITSLAGQMQMVSALSVRGSQSGTVSAVLKVSGLPSSPSGTLAAQGLLDGAPLHVNVTMEKPKLGSMHALIQTIDWKSAHADGDMTASSPTQVQGQLHLKMGQLADLRDLLGLNINGSVMGSVVLHPDHGVTVTQVHVDAQNVSAGPFVGNVQLTAEGAADGLDVKLDLQAPDLYGSKASLSATGSMNLNAQKIVVASALANYHGQDVRLLAPAQIAFANGLSVDEFKIGAKTAILKFAGEVSPALDVRASLHQVQPSLVNMFAPGLLVSGTIEGHARLQGTLQAPTGDLRLAATDVRFADDAALGLPSLDVESNAQLMQDTAKIDVKMVAGTGSQLAVSGQVPLMATGALDLKISGGLEVAMINPLLEARGQHAAGDLKMDASVTGSVAAPQINGTVNLTKGSVRDYVRGLGLTDINATLIGNQSTLQIKSLTATASPGTIAITGTIGVLQAGVPVDIHIKADKAQPLASKLVTANLNGDLHVSGTARERLNVDGTVHLNRTLIGIPNGLPPNVEVLDVHRRGKLVTSIRDKQLVVGLDVTVQAPQEILVQGRGLDAEMYGELHLGGTTDAPLVTGGFDLQRGSFSLASSKLNFTAGRISFNGAGLKNKIDPSLDFTAATTVSTTTATLHITGFADAPQFEFTSSPALGQDEIMALLLFGTSIQQLSGLQLAQIGATLATLSGVGGDSNLNPLVKLQKSLGLDRLTLGSGTTNTPTGPENAGASIAAGRYISKRVYIEAKQTTQGTSQLETDVDLTKHLKLQTRLGNGTASVQGTTPENDPGSSVGLSYQFEY